MTDPLSRRRVLLGAATGALVAIIVFGPALKPGFILGYDMVFVPKLPFSERTLGIDGSVPRAVPNDAVVATLSLLLPGWLVQKLLLVGAFTGWGAGMGALLKNRAAVAVATVAGLWNPWIAQRLEIGHWGYVLAWGALPWVAWAAMRAARSTSGGLGALATAMAVISLSGSTGAVLGLLLATVCILAGGRPRVASLVVAWGVTVAVSAAWWWPFIFSDANGSADPNGVAAFATAADTPLGTIGSALSGGGIWSQAAWYPERQNGALAVVALVVTVGAVLFLALGNHAQTLKTGLLAGAGLGLALGIAASVPGLRELLLWVVTHIPGGGLLRDAHKFLALWELAGAIGLGLAAGEIFARVRAFGRAQASIWLAAMVLLPVVLLPSLAWGSGGSWRSSNYPSDTLWLAEKIDSAEPGDLITLPWIQYRRFDWNNNRITLDPWPRLLARNVIVNDALPLRDMVIQGEDPRAAAVSLALLDPHDIAEELRRLGVRHVLILTDQPHQDVHGDDLRGAVLKARTPGTEWWDLGEVDSADTRDVAPIGWWIALAGLAAPGALMVIEKFSRKKTRG